MQCKLDRNMIFFPYQVVWKSTKKLGVGIAAVKDGFWTTTYVVARYTPPGNYYGRFKQQVGNKVLALKWNGKGKYRALFIRSKFRFEFSEIYFDEWDSIFWNFREKEDPGRYTKMFGNFLCGVFTPSYLTPGIFESFGWFAFWKSPDFQKPFPGKLRFEILRILSWMESAHKYKQPSYFRFWARFRRSIESSLRSFLPKLIIDWLIPFYVACLRSQINLEPDWSPIGLKFKISDEYLRPFHLGVPPLEEVQDYFVT